MTYIYLGSDHGGFQLKEQIKGYLNTNKRFVVEDLGCFSEDRCDYPDYAYKVAQKVLEGKKDNLGILFCGTGIGMTMTANKIKGIRAALVYDEYTARMSRVHNNANMISIGGRTTSPDQAKKIIDVWLTSKYEGGRHQERLDKINDIESHGSRRL